MLHSALLRENLPSPKLFLERSIKRTSMSGCTRRIKRRAKVYGKLNPHEAIWLDAARS